MAEIKLTAIHDAGGPHIPAEMHPMIRHRDWPGGGTVPVISICVGYDMIEIWPAEPDEIQALGERLIKRANELRDASRVKAMS